MDIIPFKEFLSSLSQISQLNFEVWDAKGSIFSSGVDRRKMPISKEVQDLSAQIMSRAIFRYASFQGQYDIFGVPINAGKEIIGSLIAYSSHFDKNSRLKNIHSERTSHAKEMQTFLTHLARLMEYTWAFRSEAEEMAEEMAQDFEDLALYGRIAYQIRRLRFSGALLKALLEDLMESVRVDLAFVDMPNRQEYNALVGKKEIPEQRSFVINLIRSIPEDAPSLKEDYFIVTDSSITPEYMRLHHDPYRFLAVKLHHDGAFDGWLGLVSFNLKELFRQSELRLLKSMAGQISVLMANIDLYHDLERFVINVVKSLVYAIEAKDVYTRGHSERVNRYSMLMADQLDLDKKQKEALNWASILHDIGKIGIPEGILNKPARLNDEEYGIVKGHPEKGCNILQPLEQLSSSLPGIMHHHERYDGKGYPHGLKGEKIPLLARIIAVADTFDAINSSRAYRPAKPPEEALAIMKQVAGSQLDPDLVEVFEDAFKTVIEPEYESSHGG